MNEQLLLDAKRLGMAFGASYPHHRDDFLGEAYLAACMEGASFMSIRSALITYAREGMHAIRIPARAQREGKAMPQREEVDVGYDPGEIDLLLLKQSFIFDGDESIIMQLTDGYTAQEIAEKEGLPPKMVYDIIYRFRDRNFRLKS